MVCENITMRYNVIEILKNEKIFRAIIRRGSLQCNPLRYLCVDQGAAAPCTPALGAIIRENLVRDVLVREKHVAPL
jgi:hypothetical protein